jgi:hypothetical protein
LLTFSVERKETARQGGVRDCRHQFKVSPRHAAPRSTGFGGTRHLFLTPFQGFHYIQAA